jgi:hypothetical protein
MTLLEIVSAYIAIGMTLGVRDCTIHEEVDTIGFAVLVTFTYTWGWPFYLLMNLFSIKIPGR